MLCPLLVETIRQGKAVRIIIGMGWQGYRSFHEHREIQKAGFDHL